MITSRRSFLSLLAAPAIVRAGSIMPVRVFSEIADNNRVPWFMETYVDPELLKRLYGVFPLRETFYFHRLELDV